MSMSKKEKEKLFCNGNVEEVKKFLSDNPTWDVNEDLGDGWTALHLACISHQHEIVSLLLAHPRIDVNQRGNSGRTVFNVVCGWKDVKIVRILLSDHRVDINMPDNRGCTPLWQASIINFDFEIMLMIASGREIDLDKKGKYDGKEYTAIEIARERGNTPVVSLLERFAENPAQTRREIRASLSLDKEDAAQVFATVVFLCDGLLQMKLQNGGESTKEQRARQFFSIATRLPLDLQFPLSNFSQDVASDSIHHSLRERGFKDAARNIHRESQTRRK